MAKPDDKYWTAGHQLSTRQSAVGGKKLLKVEAVKLLLRLRCVETEAKMRSHQLNGRLQTFRLNFKAAEIKIL